MNKIFLFLLFLVSACGFSPVHKAPTTGQQASISSQLNQIRINTIPDRSGQILRNLLLDRLYRSGTPANPEYQLIVTLDNEVIRQRGITIDATTTREELELFVTVRLKGIHNDRIYMDKKLRARSTYNILASQYGTIVTKEQAREQALEQMANDIARFLSLHFKK